MGTTLVREGTRNEAQTDKFVCIGEFDGEPIHVLRTHRRDLDEDAREREAFDAFKRAIDAIEREALVGNQECSGDDCTPEDHDLLRTFRRELVHFICAGLNHGVIVGNFPDVIRHVGEAVGIDEDARYQLIGEIDAYIAAYREPFEERTPRLVSGAEFLLGDDDLGDALIFVELDIASPSSPQTPNPAQAKPIAPRLPLLPDEFWNARATHGHIRDAARARLIPPDGVFAAVLMRVAALAPFQVLLPDIVGRYGSLNSAAVLVAPSGGGKGSSLDTARDLLALSLTSSARFREAPIGSGEGMVKAFFAQTREKGDDGKTRTEWEQRYDAIAFRVDEGETLRSLSERSGQTTMTNIRSAWSGEALGLIAADRDRGFTLAPHAYRSSLIMGVQPEHAGCLLDDAVGGTPQRFLWSLLLDPNAPELDAIPSWPGPLDWRPPDWHSAAVSMSGYQRTVMQVAAPIVTAIRERRHEITRGHACPNPLDAHADLVTLKTAALLAILDERLDVNEDDWLLAEIVVETSKRVRAWVQRQLRANAEVAEEGSIARSTRRAIAIEAAKTSLPRNVERVADVIARAVGRGGSHGLTSGMLRRALASNDRHLFDAGLANALKRGLVFERNARYLLATSALPDQ